MKSMESYGKARQMNKTQAGTWRPPVLRRCISASYVPLCDDGSESVPAAVLVHFARAIRNLFIFINA